MLTGYNHNLRHRGVIFHVQTEDGGSRNPYVITTVFHRGNVVASRRQSYEKFVGAKNWEEIVLAMMQEQHREIMKDVVNHRLRGVGEIFDTLTPPEGFDTVQAPPPTAGPPPVAPPAVARTEAKPAERTLDSAQIADKTLDELILEFLKDETGKKK